MRRTWIGAAAAAGITTFAATGLALAQEKQDQQTPETQRMEKARPAQIDKGQRAAEPGAGQGERQMGKEAQEQKAPQAGPNAEQKKAQTGQAMRPENRQGEKAQTGQAAAPEKAQTGQAVAPETRQGGQTPSGQGARTDQGQPSNAMAPHPGGNATAVGKVQISSTTASRISEALISAAPAPSLSVCPESC